MVSLLTPPKTHDRSCTAGHQSGIKDPFHPLRLSEVKRLYRIKKELKLSLLTAAGAIFQTLKVLGKAGWYQPVTKIMQELDMGWRTLNYSLSRLQAIGLVGIEGTGKHKRICWKDFDCVEQDLAHLEQDLAHLEQDLAQETFKAVEFKDFQPSSNTLTNISTNTLSQLEREEGEEVTRESRTKEQVDLPSPLEVKVEQEKFQEQQNPGEGRFSAAAAPVKILEKSHNVKYARPNYHLNGFESQEEKDGFYQALLELGKQKADVRSPVGWTCNIIKDINAGGTCEYLNEYRRGEPLGMCEKQEWENAPGEPYPRFLTFLRGRLKTNQMSGEQAIAAVHKALRDTNQAKELWESFKRTAVNFADQWERDKALGLSGAYVPPELLPEAEVAIEEAAQAMYALQEGSSVQMQSAVLPAAPQPAIEPAAVSSDEPEEESLAQKVSVWQKMWNAPNAELFGRRMVRRFVAETPGVILTDDGPVLENPVEPDPVEEELLKVGDRVFVNSWPHTDRFGPFLIEWIDGNYAKLELFEKPVLLKDLRRSD